MTRPLKVFLCHAHSDKDTVKALYARLKREGVDAWLDKEKLIPGADWEYEIRKAVRESDVVIVCLSKQFNQAGFRQREVRIALEEADNKPEGEIFIIPARLEECDSLDSLRKWHWVNLFESDGYRLLIRALRTRADKIGATLLQRGTTTSRPKPKPEQQDAEKERAEKAERERLAREAAEKTERERLDREAAEKAERERLAREATEKAERERLAREAAEKTERERLASESTEKAERERLTREADEKAERERLARQSAEKAERGNAAKQKPAKPTLEKKRAPAPNLNLRGLGIAGFVVASVLLALWGGYYQIKNSNSSTTETLVSVSPSSTEPKPRTETLTFTPVPPTFTPTPGIGSTMTSEKDGMVLVYVPEGEFTMGSDTGSSDEQPVHTVNLDAFWIDQTEVTNAMYAKCVADGDCDPPSSSSSYTHDSYYGNSTYDEYPVIYVNWNQAAAYCKWAGRELPTEAQWEKAARGTDGRTYPWGDTFDGTIVNFCDANCPFDWADKTYDDGYADVSPVGNYPSGKSIYGALDMAGNVWEWVADWYDSNYYDISPSSNPLGPSSGQSRVLRGGAWDGFDDYARSAFRYDGAPVYVDLYVGFRCARSLP